MEGLRAVVGAAVLVALYLGAPLESQLWWLSLVVGLVALMAILPYAYRRTIRVSTSDRPLVAAAQALFVVAGMVVFGFSSVYVAIDRHGDQFVGLGTRLDAVYFTVTTIATVGYGDIHPVGQMGRGIVTLQMLFDLSLLALSVKLLSAAARARVHPSDPVPGAPG